MHRAEKVASTRKIPRGCLLCGCSIVLIAGVVALVACTAEIIRLLGHDAEARRIARRLQTHFPGHIPPYNGVYGGGMSCLNPDSRAFSERLWNRQYPCISGKVNRQETLDRIRADVKRICDEEGYQSDLVFIHVLVEPE